MVACNAYICNRPLLSPESNVYSTDNPELIKVEQYFPFCLFVG